MKLSPIDWYKLATAHQASQQVLSVMKSQLLKRPSDLTTMKNLETAVQSLEVVLLGKPQGRDG